MLDELRKKFSRSNKMPETNKSPQLNLKLVDTADLPENLISNLSISPCGDFVYIAYQYPGPSPGLAAAELFRNDDGKLNSIHTLPIPSEFPVTLAAGAASNDFTRFVVLLQEAGDGIGRGIVIVHDIDFNIINSRIIDGVNLTTQSFLLQQPFTPGNTFIAISLLDALSPVPNAGRLLILETETLETVTEERFEGVTNGPFVFILENKCGCVRYFVYVASAGLTEEFEFVAPAQASVWEFFPETRNLVLRDQVPLPQFSSVTDIVTIKGGSLALIAAPTRRADGFGEVPVFKIPSPPLSTLDGKELRLYTFDGSNLRLVIAQDIGSTVFPASLYPTGKYIVYGTPNPISTVLAPAFKIDLFNERLICAGDKIHNLPVTALAAKFSDNGKWFAASGGSNGPLESIQLYRVFFGHDNRCDA